MLTSIGTAIYFCPDGPDRRKGLEVGCKRRPLDVACRSPLVGLPSPVSQECQFGPAVLAALVPLDDQSPKGKRGGLLKKVEIVNFPKAFFILKSNLQNMPGRIANGGKTRDQSRKTFQARQEPLGDTEGG